MKATKRYEIVDDNCKHLGWAKTLDDAQVDVNAFAQMGYSFSHIIDQKRLVEVPTHVINANGKGVIYVDGAEYIKPFGLLYMAEQRVYDIKGVC